MIRDEKNCAERIGGHVAEDGRTMIAAQLSEPIQLNGSIQHYEWGAVGRSAVIPKLLGCAAGEAPWAELWLGIHSKGPAMTMAGVGLNDYFTDADIPWLLKILDARKMLSVQVHPDKVQAQAGYARETRASVSSDQRNYKDANPKPEIAIPLSEMWLMGGFLDKNSLVSRFRRYECVHRAFRDTINLLEQASDPEAIAKLKRSLYEQVNRLEAVAVHRVCEELARELVGGQFDKNQIEYWILKSNTWYPNDVGVFSFFMLNLVRLTPKGIRQEVPLVAGDALLLAPGEAFYTPPGVPHFYLEGACIEHMANSDNVLRAGFTPKYKDIDELLAVVDYRELPRTAHCVQPESLTLAPNVERLIYQQAGNDYFRTEITTLNDKLAECTDQAAAKPKIAMVLSGSIQLHWPGNAPKIYQQGESFLVPSAPGCSFEVTALLGNSQYLVASTPQ